MGSRAAQVPRRQRAGEGHTGGERAAHVTATARAVELAGIAAEAAAEKLATDIIAYDVSEQLVITDVFLLCSAANDRQVRAIVDEIEERLRKAGVRPVRREGEREGRWVLLDYLDLVIHIQHAEERTYYALERLWKDCPRLPLPEPAGLGGPPPAGAPAHPRRRWQAHRPGQRRLQHPTGPRNTRISPSGWCGGGTGRPSGTLTAASRGRATSRWTPWGSSRPSGPRACSLACGRMPSCPPTWGGRWRRRRRWPG